MGTSEVVALSIFASYFLIIIALFSLILKSFQISGRRWLSEPHSRNALLFFALAIGSFAHTWFYMFKFMAWSFKEHESTCGRSSDALWQRVSAWLVETALFEQAWSTVCSGPLNWWWSEQLCTYTAGAWTLFVFVEGQRFRIKHIWAYMLLGQFVAISVAANLFYVALSLSQYKPHTSRQQEQSTHPILWSAVLLSLVTVARSPYTNENTFLPNLLLMHGLLTIPLILVSLPKPSSLAETTRFSISPEALHRLIFLSASLIRLSSTLSAIQSVGPMNLSQFLEAAWKTLYSHPAQSSIGWDVIWTTMSFVVWSCMTSETSSVSQRSVLAILTPVVSASVVSPFMKMIDSHDGRQVNAQESRKVD